MKRILIASIAVLFCSAVFTQTIPVAGIDSLVNKTLSQDLVLGLAELTFMKNSGYSLRVSSAGPCWIIEGKYEVAGGKMLMHPEKCYDNIVNRPVIPCGRSMGEAVATLIAADKDLYFSRYLRVEPVKNQNMPGDFLFFSFGIPDSKVPEGSARTIAGIPVITTGMKEGVTTANAKIREKPSVDSKALQYSESPFGPGAPLPSVPAGTKVIVKARTVDRVKVSEWSNYWYYIDAGMSKGVWMYGEFIKMK